MTHRQLIARVERWRELILPEWRIDVIKDLPDEAPSDGPPNARIEAAPDYHHATVWFNPELLKRDQSDVDVTIIHELLHPLLREMRRVVDMVEDQVGRPLFDVLREYMESEEEKVVERLARIIGRIDYPDGVTAGTSEAPS